MSGEWLSEMVHILAEWDFSGPELPIDNWWFCAIVLVVLMFVIWLVARLVTTATEEIDPAEVDRQMLSAVTELKTRGELSTEEFRSIKSRLVDRLSDDPPNADSADFSDKVQREKESQGTADRMTETPEGTNTSAKSAQGENPDANESGSTKDQTSD